ncbi:formate/nitrite transporter family protein [Salinarimonas ramus]|nr:formate/nitrite transporter family protein [Salinarimonas ramus]
MDQSTKRPDRDQRHTRAERAKDDLGASLEAPTFGEIKERAPASARLVHETIRAEGEAEMRRPVGSLAWSGLAAGLAMGFSLVVEGLLHAGLPDEPWRGLISSFGYSVGFLIVILGRQQLFTESTLTVVLPALHRRTAPVLLRMVRMWAVVLSANLVGVVAFAAMAALTDVFTPEARAAFAEIGRAALEGDAWTTFLRAIVAGWLIALMVWLMPEAGSARFLVIVTITYVVALAGLAHVIAGSVEATFAAFAGDASWREVVVGFLLPALAGNIVGGVTLTALLNYGQVHAELENDGSVDGREPD